VAAGFREGRVGGCLEGGKKWRLASEREWPAAGGELGREELHRRIGEIGAESSSG
jgi:hypothetical protein